MSLKLLSPTGGSVTLDAPSTASDYTIIMPPANGNTLVTPLPAGTSTEAPLVLTTGTSLTAPVAGAVEYDGDTLLFTPIGSQRGAVPAIQTMILNAGNVGLNATGAQSIFGDSVTVASSTIYRFQSLWFPAKTAGTTSHTISVLFGGTATLNWIAYDTQWNSSTTGYTLYSTGGSYQGANTASAMVITSARTSATEYGYVRMFGSLSVNNGGTLTPQYSLSAAPGGAYTIQRGSWFEIYPLAPAGSDVMIGTWS